MNIKILVIDNYDSFVYNLVHILKNLEVETVDVIKNDKTGMDEVSGYNKILLSPGPGLPKDAGLMPAIIQQYAATKSILGVCLGHQAIGEYFGGTLINLKEPLHGISSNIKIVQQDYLFANIPSDFKIGHYHSWVVSSQLPKELEILAKDDKDNIMALKHVAYDVRGVQFHPESILTEHGKTIIENWINH
ncbi:MAG: aminodeoxychorismate/anthranilate synthase component II [Chitinophagales bacterium]